MSPQRLTFETAKQPYRLRSWLRGQLPWVLVNHGWMQKGRDCEAKGGQHEWYNIDNENSGCYHCSVVCNGELWKSG